MESLLIRIFGFSLTIAVILWVIAAVTRFGNLRIVALVPALVAAVCFASLVLLALR